MVKTLFVIIPVVAMACASGGSGSAATPSRDRNLIAMDEIKRASAANAYDLVRSARPNWLNVRGENSFRETPRGSASGSNVQVVPGIDMLVVYLDNARLGGVETLRQVPVASLTSLQYFDAKAATHKWGSGHTHGAILVSTAPTPVPPPQ